MEDLQVAPDPADGAEMPVEGAGGRTGRVTGVWSAIREITINECTQGRVRKEPTEEGVRAGKIRDKVKIKE